ncbi:hypothetical protein Bhyg_01126, partial [Pseudolycoriella hygida]
WYCLEKALLDYTKDPSLYLIDYKIRDNSSEVSQHFSSILFKVELQYKRVTEDEVYKISAFVKTLPDSPDQSHNSHLKYVKESAQFDTELKVYDKILPKVDIILYNLGLQSLAPKQIYQTNNTSVPILIMEDMTSLGYKTTKYRSQLSLDAAKILIEKLAQFHATSLVLDQQMDETVSKLNGVFFDFHTNESYCDDMDKCVEMMKTFNGFEHIVEKLEGTFQEMFKKVRDVYYNSESTCKVLNHGDMKFENTLVKTNGNDIENGVFVDFAYTNFQTPAIDLFEFLYKVPALDVIIHKEQRDQLVDHYLETIRTILTKMAFERVEETVEEFKNELERCNILQIWFVMFLVVYQLQVCNQENDADRDILDYEEYWLKTVLNELLK